jgi:hypothetical protein
MQFDASGQYAPCCHLARVLQGCCVQEPGMIRMINAFACRIHSHCTSIVVFTQPAAAQERPHPCTLLLWHASMFRALRNLYQEFASFGKPVRSYQLTALTLM